MAIAKTPKKRPPAAPAAAKPAARAAAPKRVSARAAAAKPVEDAVVHSAEIVAEQGARATRAAERTAKASEAVTGHAARVSEAAARQAAETVTEQTARAAETVKEVAENPSRAVTVVRKTAENTQESMMKGVVSFLDFGRDHAILMVATGNRFALGLHQMSRSLIDWSAEGCDKSVAASQAMLSAGSVEEIIDLSRGLAKDGLDHLLKEGAELSALSSKLIEDTIVPLPGRLAAAVEKLASRAA